MCALWVFKVAWVPACPQNRLFRYPSVERVPPEVSTLAGTRIKYLDFSQPSPPPVPNFQPPQLRILLPPCLHLTQYRSIVIIFRCPKLTSWPVLALHPIDTAQLSAAPVFCPSRKQSVFRPNLIWAILESSLACPLGSSCRRASFGLSAAHRLPFSG